MTPLYFEKQGKNILKCTLCPHHCRIKPQHGGVCGVRENVGGEMILPYYGRLSSVAVDPIEKKPLYHFFPGRTILSVGFWGCNFQCPFCQNYRISQNLSTGSEYISPGKLVELTLQQRSFGIAYTYSEPLVHFEYILETAKLARSKGLKNVLVSNGHINRKPAEEILPWLDAANIDFKSNSEEFYKKEIHGNLDAVKEFLAIAADSIRLEITTLVIPGKNDSDEEIGAIASYIASLDKNIPLHLSCYYPTYKYTIPPTNPDSIFRLTGVAGKYLNYIYPGNVGLRAINTSCPGCNSLLISRAGYRTTVPGLENGKCKKCGTDIPISMEK